MQVLVTLQEPWIGTRDGSIKKRMGFGAPIIERDSQFANQVKSRPGQELWWELSPDKPRVLMDEKWAQAYFGDWTAVEYREEGGAGVRINAGERGAVWEQIPTIAEEKDRVANVWGGVRKTSERGKKMDAIIDGMADIGPPQVPHVKIESVGPDGQPDGAVVFEPWEFFGWGVDFPDFDELAAGPRNGVYLTYGGRR